MSTFSFSAIFFILLWILSAIIIDGISQKRADKPYLKKAYRM